jgi:hypothetical protein
MVTLTAPNSAGHEPETQRKLFSPSPDRARVRAVVPAFCARQLVHVGADHDAIPSTIAACPAVIPNAGGMLARLILYEMGSDAGFHRDALGW